jgi:hypothetical protein
VAARAHGSARLTNDLAILYRRTPENIARLASILAPHVEVRCLNLDRLIQVKRAAGRPKDLEVIAELEALLEERDRRDA